MVQWGTLSLRGWNTVEEVQLRVDNNCLTLFMKQKCRVCLRHKYLKIHCWDCSIFEIVLFLCLQNFCLPLGISLIMLQLIFIQGLWLTRKWLHVLLWDIPQQMQGSMRVLCSKCSTSCLCYGTWPWAVTESNFCAATFCSVVHFLWNSQVVLKWCWLHLFFSTGLYLFFASLCIIFLVCTLFEINIWWLLGHL